MRDRKKTHNLRRISQVATALYNAAFFGGLTLVDHTPRSFYISRYSHRAGRTVEAWTRRPHSYVQPMTQFVRNRALPRGAQRVVQEAGGPGFTIEYGRRVLRGSSVVRNERLRVRYEPVNRIVEIGTG